LAAPKEMRVGGGEMIEQVLAAGQQIVADWEVSNRASVANLMVFHPKCTGWDSHPGHPPY